MENTKRVWVALGSNLGESNIILQQAWQELGAQEAIELVTLSSPYVSEPVGLESENLFLNAVGILETILCPEALLVLLQQVERGFGRDKKSDANGYQDRLLDLDMLYFVDSVIRSETLVVPHPHISERLFVLAPLVEIDPDHRDPLNSDSAVEMYHRLLHQIESGAAPLQEFKRDSWTEFQSTFQRN